MGGDNSKVIAASLPNITGGYITERSTHQITAQHGAFLNTHMENGSLPQYASTTNGVTVVDFDASNSNEIYGKSDKVLPESFALIAQIKY